MQKIHKAQEQRDGVPAQHRTTSRTQRSGKSSVIFTIGRHDIHIECVSCLGYSTSLEDTDQVIVFCMYFVLAVMYCMYVFFDFCFLLLKLWIAA